jgi:hypothetical protein
MLLRIARCLINRKRGVSAFAETYANAAFLIADHNDQTEIKAASASHHAGHAACINSDLIELAALARWAGTISAASGSSANAPRPPPRTGASEEGGAGVRVGSAAPRSTTVSAFPVPLRFLVLEYP